MNDPPPMIQRTAGWLACLLLWAGCTLVGTDTARAQTAADPVTDPDDNIGRQSMEATVETLLASMTVADRIGQLFVIPFQGSSIRQSDAIVRLVHDYRVGAVVLTEQNGNIDNAPGSDTPRQVAALTSQLQALPWGLYTPRGELPPDRADIVADHWMRLPDPLLETGLGIPLLIGVSQTGPDQSAPVLRSGFTAMPNQMAVGAAWDPAYAQALGTILGQELAAVGINMLLGPSLDVLGSDGRQPSGVRATSTYGGDSWWVAENGVAFIQGVADGSSGRVLSIAGHFPGQGGSDRDLNRELATIQRSLTDLQRNELLPFVRAVQARRESETSGSGSPMAGLLTSHIRYSGFLSSRERTPPISLAPQLEEILALDAFADWREAGGLLMSGKLIVPSLSSYYGQSGQTSFANRIANDAFQAGNDLLWLAGSGPLDPNAASTLQEVILFFNVQYLEKPDFARAVDNTVRRILQAKLRLYPPAFFDRAAWTKLEEADNPLSMQTIRRLAPVGASQADPEVVAVGFDPLVGQMLDGVPDQLSEGNLAVKAGIITWVAQDAATLLHLDAEQAADQVRAVPNPDDRLLIFTDDRTRPTCPGCQPETVLAVDQVEATILRLFGPDATAQIEPDRISSYGFGDVVAWLNRTANTVAQFRMDRALTEATWVIFAMLDVDPEQHPASEVVHQFLRQKPDLLLGKRVAVLSFDAPYMLDETEISKLSVYIAAYSPNPPFVETAVRGLFHDLEMSGAPPVNVPGTPYGSLVERLEPDPNQVIPLTVFDDKHSSLDLQALEVRLGDSLQIRAGPILDRNGNRVPDGTPVEFLLRYPSDNLDLRIDPIPTRDGSATMDLLLDRAGTLELAARSLESTTSIGFQIRVEEESAAQILTVQPTVTPLTNTDPPSAEPDPAINRTPALRWTLTPLSFLGSLAVLLACLGLYAVLWARDLAVERKVLNMLWGAGSSAGLYVAAAFVLPFATPHLNQATLMLVTAILSAGSCLVALAWLHLVRADH
ncbi:MAG: hypothetical protein F4Y37_11560 [Caldilineaceae bacterium SB0664_bin_22]|nr:hypothetical protein [Caldilineaceae bacterium SB0664_bin_22]MYC61569.1 hypothetical protein [Caldilineaceae bacterium SB0661_bin_34]